jgi:hypothetical protein
MPTTKTMESGTPVVAGAARLAFTVNNKALTSNVATLTTPAAHGLAVGDIVEVAGIDSVFDGTWAVASVPTSTTFTFARTNANVGTVAVSPVAPGWRTHNNGGVTASNKLAVNGLVTLTVASHTLVVGDWIVVSVGDPAIDGLRQVWSVPSSTLVCFKVPGASIATAACGGAVGKATSAWVQILSLVAAATTNLVSTICIANNGEYAARVKVARSTSITPTIAEHKIPDSVIAPGEALLLTIGEVAGTGLYIMGRANQPDVSFSLAGISKTVIS